MVACLLRSFRSVRMTTVALNKKRGALAAQPPVLPSFHENVALVILNGVKDHYPVKRSARHYSLCDGPRNENLYFYWTYVWK